MSNATEQAEASNVAPLPVQRPQIVVSDDIPVLDTGRFEQMQRIASAMASSSLVPAHLVSNDPRVSQANCFLVVNQAVRWRMDPFALAQHAFVIHGRLGYEGKVVAAVVNGNRRLARKLSYAYEGQGDKRTVTVSGTLSGEEDARTIEGSVAVWKTNNENWTKAPDQMLAYRGAREWARRHMPEAMLGVFSDDELIEMAENRPVRDITPPSPPPAPPSPPAPPAAEQEVIPPKPTRAKGKRDGTPYKDMAKEQEPAAETDEAEPFDADKWLDDIESMMAGCADQAALDEVWNGYVEPTIETGVVFPPDRQKANDAFEAHMARIENREPKK